MVVINIIISLYLPNYKEKSSILYNKRKPVFLADYAWKIIGEFSDELLEAQILEKEQVSNIKLPWIINLFGEFDVGYPLTLSTTTAVSIMNYIVLN